MFELVKRLAAKAAAAAVLILSVCTLTSSSIAYMTRNTQSQIKSNAPTHTLDNDCEAG